MGQRRYRYNTVTPANPKSKNFARKQAAAERKARVEGKPYVPPTISTQKGSNAGGRRVKSELKSASQIAKQRILKEKRREKTGRHHKNGKKK
jgi:ATP-dependent RNA helicase DDX54/DBP10